MKIKLPALNVVENKTQEHEIEINLPETESEVTLEDFKALQTQVNTMQELVGKVNTQLLATTEALNETNKRLKKYIGETRPVPTRQSEQVEEGLTLLG